jgi:putative ABC transport system permease protein
MFNIIIKLAWNNAFLRLSRTILVILMIAISMAMMLSIQGIYDGMTLNMIDKTLRSDSGEISLYHKNYRLDKNLKHNIKDASQIQTFLQTNNEIEYITKRLSVEGLSATARKSAFSNVIGINLENEIAFGQFNQFLKKGDMSFRKRGALLGSELAKTLKVNIGSKIIFSTQDHSGDINSIAVRVRGIVQTSNIALDASAVYVDLKQVQKFLGVNNQMATQIAIRTHSQTLLKELKNKYPELDVKNFLELYPMLKQMKDMMVIFTSITFLIVMLVVLIGITGVMYVSILDRIREFGIMRALGMSYQNIRYQIFLEAFLVGLTGYILGAILGFSTLYYLQNYGLNLSQYSEGMESFGMDTIIYAQMNISYFTSTFYAIITASLLSVLLPLIKIKKLNPIDVIKAET